ncbi:MAG TPA: oligopeptide/dipeptide ABC transporter ATP-binding protein [Mycobacteriales bacterium]|nr:oligopeptide/dipeptide ABC transporter ATP-binding protein [Mycobacteriales bacterium]
MTGPDGRQAASGTDAGDGERDWLGDAERAMERRRDVEPSRGADPETQGPVGTTAAEGAARAGEAADVLLSARGLQVHFPIRRGLFFDRTIGHVRAVDGVDLDLPRGGTYGLVGESGCGKSTLGRALLRLVEPTAGSVTVDGVDVLALKGEQLRRQRRKMQMVFQDPLSSLDPRQNIESILSEPLQTHDVVKGAAARQARVRELLDTVGLPQTALPRYPHEFSGGQRQRIGIARAIALEPELIVADEPVSALDVSIQAQIVNLLEELQDRLGLTYLVIAHDLAVVRHIADVVGVMYLGVVVEQTSSHLLYTEPLHPYTRALMSAVPIPDPDLEDSRQRILLSGDLPSPANPPSGCRFRTRCPWVQETRCADEVPVLREVRPDHVVACHYAEQIDSGEIRPKAEAIVS